MLAAMFGVSSSWYCLFRRISGYVYSDSLGKVHFWLRFIGANPNVIVSATLMRRLSRTRFTEAEISQAVQPLRERLTTLEAENVLTIAAIVGEGQVFSSTTFRKPLGPPRCWT
jgi:heme/copper-type cytochrome/quinol oxidase subunit 1